MILAHRRGIKKKRKIYAHNVTFSPPKKKESKYGAIYYLQAWRKHPNGSRIKSLYVVSIWRVKLIAGDAGESWFSYRRNIKFPLEIAS